MQTGVTMNRKQKFSIKLIASIVLFHWLSISIADDTELFFSERNSTSKPNLLFVMDVSGSMDKKIDPDDAASKTRLEVMQTALRTVLTSAPKNLNVGIMDYGELERDRDQGQYPSGVSFPISDIEAEALPIVRDSLGLDDWGNVQWWKSKTPEPTATRTVREYISDITDYYFKDSWYRKQYQGKTEAEIAMPRYGNTPIVDALYEAARYFRGDKLYFGQRDASHYKEKWSGIGRAAHPSTYEGAPISWQSDLCAYDKYDVDWKFKKKTFYSAAKYNNRWGNSGSGRWSSSYKCAVDKNNAKAVPASKAACQTNESCSSWWTAAKPAKPAVPAGPRHCHKRYGPWYCPVAEQTDENGVKYCPVGKKRDRKYPDTCHSKAAKPAVPAVPAQQRWSCKIPRCTGGITSEPNYTSPIKSACQSNFIVLMSDGKPQYSRRYDNRGNRDGTNRPGIIAERLHDNRDGIILKDKSNPSKQFKKQSCKDNPTPSGYASGKCGPELTKFLAESDQKDGDGFEGKQTVNTFAIGFGLDPAEPKADEYLESLVTTDLNPETGRKYGYFSAGDEVTLAAAFDSIVREIGASTDSLASAGYSVNVKSGVSHEDHIYLPVFRKKDQPAWVGNIKKFKIKEIEGRRTIVDKNEVAATTELGVIRDEAQDLWSSTKDGQKVQAGGAANLLPKVADRKLLTNSGSGNSLKALKTTTSSIDFGLLGLSGGEATDKYREKLIRFIRGERYDTDSKKYVQRFHMGDMMHSDPIVITYEDDYATSGDAGGQVLYIGTNEGFLHAIDTVTGKELFAFMPKVLLKNINKQYKNASGEGHIYGVDGPMTIWNKLDPNDSSKVVKRYLYFGLRRGGSAYYALDITDPSAPLLKWKLDKDTTYGGTKVFANMGQTWSRMTHAKIRKNRAGDMREVVTFSGGYDINQDLYADFKLNPLKEAESDDDDDDDKGKSKDKDKDKENGSRLKKKSNDSVGRDIFIVDAEEGPTTYSWSMRAKAKNASALNHSVPGGARMVDLNKDGAVDRMYFGDLDGNVWRLELPSGPTYDIDTQDKSKLIKFAKLAGSEKEHRKFFSEPDVALLNYKGKPYLSISIGSGYRAHPLYEGIKDNFFVLIDKDVYSDLIMDSSDPKVFEKIVYSDLEKLTATITDGAFSLTTGALKDGKTIIDLVTAKTKRGWALELPSKGEKVLSTSLTRGGKLVFTTLAPNTEGEGNASTDECGVAPTAQGRAYVLDILTAQAAHDMNEDGSETNAGDIMLAVTDNAIPNSPQSVFNEPACDDATRTCTQNIDIRVDKKSTALIPVPLNYLEPRYWSNPAIEEGK